MKEDISVLIDQEADRAQRSEAVDRLCADPEAASTWQRFHLIGGVIRGEFDRTGPCVVQSVADRLKNEPTVLAPAVSGQRAEGSRTDDIWKSAGMMALAASLALVAVVSLKPGSDPSAAQIAVNTTTPAADESRQQFHQEFGEMLVEHGEFTSSPALNGLVAYAKLVSNQQMDR